MTTAFVILAAFCILLGLAHIIGKFLKGLSEPAPTDQYWEPLPDEAALREARVIQGMERLKADMLVVDDDGVNGPGIGVRALQPEDAYSKKLRLNAEHEAELAGHKPLTAAQREAQAAHAANWYLANRARILQERKDARIAKAIAEGRKPRVHATYLRQDDNPYPVHSPEYQKFAAEKRQRFHEQKHAVAALTPAPANPTTSSEWVGTRPPLAYTYGQRALA